MDDLNSLSLAALAARLRATGLVTPLIRLAYQEDLGWQSRDVTSLCIAAPIGRVRGAVVARGPGVVAGLAWAPDVLAVFAPHAEFKPALADGARVAAGTRLATIAGPARQVLRAERTLLNLIGRLSGVATLTAGFVAAMGKGGAGGRAVGGRAGARLYDTRKTTPGLRVLEKYAVRCGGGFCHRLGLHDAVLIKDNHLAGLAGPELTRFVAAAASRARALRPRPAFVEVEVDSLDQLEAVLACRRGLVDIVLLDNMPTAMLRRAVRMRDAAGRGGPRLEASGGVTVRTIRSIARTGVERISAGAITHQAPSLDVALDLESDEGASPRPRRGRPPRRRRR